MRNLPDWVAIPLAVIGAGLIVGGPIIGLGMAGGYYQGCQEARIFNMTHDSHWSCWDFMWAGDQINRQTITVRHD